MTDSEKQAVQTAMKTDRRAAERAMMNALNSLAHETFGRYNYQTRLVDKPDLKEILRGARVIRTVSADGSFITFYINTTQHIGYVVSLTDLYEEKAGLIEVPMAEGNRHGIC